MRRYLAALLVLLGPCSLLASAQAAAGCNTGLCLQQTACPGGGTTSISGTVFAPNGTDPLPNVTVYIPNATVDPFTPGVSCPVIGAPPSGQPIAGATTDFDGSFTILNAPIGTNIPLVIVSGRWRRQIVVPVTNSCANVTQNVRFPRNQSEGDIPKIAIATGSADSVECVLRKVGIDDAEFTDPSGTGRINFFVGSNGPGSRISSSTPNETTLMENASTLNAYDVLMLPCEGTGALHTGNAALASQLTNLVAFANAGGRVYSSHYSYTWMYNNPPFNTVANWFGTSKSIQNTGVATVNTSFSEGNTLALWLQLVGATTTQGQMTVDAIKHDFAGVNSPTQTWLTLNDALDADTKPVMQFVFDAPVGNSTNQCGRVLYNEYHVETAGGSSVFPAECAAGSNMTPQEKLLEFSLFELTNDGGEPTLTPPSADFGNQAVGFATSPINFTWTNNSSFTSSVTAADTTGDFHVTSNNCGKVFAGSSCNIGVNFLPTVLGPETGKLTVQSTGKTIYAQLTGTGVPGLLLTPSTLAFGNVDVGNTVSQNLQIANVAPGAIPLPSFVLTGDYTASTNCPAAVPANSACTITISFTPTTTGSRPGSISLASAYSTQTSTFTGNGVDFTLALTPVSGTVIAGYSVNTVATMTPVAGFNASVTLSCAFNVPGASCTTSNGVYTYNLAAATQSTMSIGTTSKYNVIGYGSLWLAGLASGLVVCLRRRRAGILAQRALLLFVFACGAVGLSGCSGKMPVLNPVYTAPGNYTFTVTATDGFLSRSATYTLTTTTR